VRSAARDAPERAPRRGPAAVGGRCLTPSREHSKTSIGVGPNHGLRCQVLGCTAAWPLSEVVTGLDAGEYDDLVLPILDQLRQSSDPEVLVGALNQVLADDYGLLVVGGSESFARNHAEHGTSLLFVLQMSDVQEVVMAAAASARLEFRVRPDRKSLIERAAELVHQPVSEFARAAVEEKADRIIREHEATTVVPSELFDDLLAAFDAPSKPNAMLTRAAQRRHTVVTVIDGDLSLRAAGTWSARHQQVFLWCADVGLDQGSGKVVFQ